MKFEENFEEQYNEFLANISNLYYNENKTQSEIAKEFGTTRFKIAKYLQEARDKNIVTIEINHPETRVTYLENKFKKHFNLKEAIILKVNNNDVISISQTIGKTAADYIQSIINENIEILHSCAKLLLEKEKISGDEFRALFPPNSLPEKKKPTIIDIVEEEQEKQEEPKQNENI